MAGLQIAQKWDAGGYFCSRRCLNIPLWASCIISMTRKTRNKTFLHKHVASLRARLRWRHGGPRWDSAKVGIGTWNDTESSRMEKCIRSSYCHEFEFVFILADWFWMHILLWFWSTRPTTDISRRWRFSLVLPSIGLSRLLLEVVSSC